jgi:hypothetical protein
MSLHALKRKGIILHGGGYHLMCKSSPNISGKSPGGYWIEHPSTCGGKAVKRNMSYSETGFSINGGRRDIGGIGRNRRQYSTPFKGQYAKGHGGTNGKYIVAKPVWTLTDSKVEVMGTQNMFIKPSTLDTSTMLRKKLLYMLSGTYPQVWVQPTYPNGTLHENASMSSYIQKLKTQQNEKSSTTPSTTTQCCTTPQISKCVPPLASSDYQENLQRCHLNPQGIKKPFPFNVSNNSNANALNGFLQPYYTSPPAWYTKLN